MKNQNNEGKGRCPVCGKYANKAMIDKYNKLVEDNKQLQSRLSIKEGLVNSLKEENTKLSNNNAGLRKTNDELLAENERLSSRGFWARLFNLQ